VRLAAYEVQHCWHAAKSSSVIVLLCGEMNVLITGEYFQVAEVLSLLTVG
jgi:hypothetical protein